MSPPTSWRPSTGAESVPFPCLCHGDGPEADAAWAQYWRDREKAAGRETADEAIVRCRAEADSFADGGPRFDHAIDIVIETFDRQVADLARPNGEKYRGLGLDESGFFSSYQINRMSKAWAAMAQAFADLDREQYRKAAAEFAGALADMTVGMSSTTPNPTGGAS